MNIWKRFLSLALVLALVLSMGPIIPFVQANAETTENALAETLTWDFSTMESLPTDLTASKHYSLSDGELLFTCFVDRIHSGSLTVNTAGSQNWTDYEVSTVVTTYKNASGGFSYPAILLHGGIQIRITPDPSTANKYTIRPYQNGWLANGTSVNVAGGKVTSTAGPITFKVTARIVGNCITVAIDDVFVYSYVYTGNSKSGTIGVVGFHTSNTNCEGEHGPDKISYKYLTVSPVVLADKEELYNNGDKTSLATSDGWNNNRSLSGNFEVQYLKSLVTDGSAEVTFTLPETRPTSGSNPQYDIFFVLGSVTIEATLLYQMTNANALYFRLGIRGSEYNSGFKQIGDTYDIKGYNGSDPEKSVWGKEVTMKLRKMGNFFELDVAIPALSLSKTISCTLSDKYANTSYVVKVRNLNAAAAFSSVKINSVNKTAKITIDESAADLVTLPSYEDPAGTSFDRSAFEFGETIALKTAIGYDYFANGVKIEDPDNFVIPNAETVTITAEEIPTYTVTAPEGVTVTPAGELRAGTQVMVTVDPTRLNPATLKVNGESVAVDENNRYTFTMPAGDVEITCDAAVVPPVSATYADSVYEAGKWTTTDTSAYVSEPFANGYIEVEYAISGTISGAANLFVRSPKTAGGSLFGHEEEIMLRWTVAADTSEAGYTHKATSTLVIRDNAAPGYQLKGDNSIHGDAKTVYLNIKEGTPATMKVKMEIVGNLLRIYVNDVLHQEATFDPQYRIASQAGYFGYYGLSNNATVTTATVQEVKAYIVTVPENVVADETAHLIKPHSTYGSAFGRSTYVAGETVTLKLDELYMDSTTLKVNGSRDGISGSNGTYTFTMPAEAVTVTCDKRVTYTITENVDNLSVNKTEAPAGAIVTITLDETKLDADTLEVNGGAVEVTGSNGTYTFEMPAGDVTITCDVLELPANQSLYTNDGKTNISTGWDGTLTSDGTAINGDGTVYYNTVMDNGWIKATVTLPNLKDEQKATLKGGTPANTQMFYMFYVKDGTDTIQAGVYYHRNSGFIVRVRGMSGTYNGIANTGEQSADLNGKTVEMELRKVGNYLEFKIVATDGSYSKTISSAFSGTTLRENVQFGIYHTIPTLDTSIKGNWTNIQVGRINETVTVTVDNAAAGLVKLPATYDFAAKPSEEEKVNRTAYQIDEIIALTVEPNYAAYIGDEKITNPSEFVVPENDVVITAKPDTAPYYVNTFDNADSIANMTNSNTTDETNYSVIDGKLVYTVVEGETKDAAQQNLMTDISYLPDSFVTSVDVIALPQKLNGVVTKFPWLGVTVNGIEFRAIPKLDADKKFNGQFGIAVKDVDFLPDAGTNLANTLTLGNVKAASDGSVSFSIAVVVKNSTKYTMYVNGIVAYEYTLNNIRANSAAGVLTAKWSDMPESITKYDNLRIDRVGSVDEVTFGDKQLALNDDLTVDFNVALPAGTTATAAKITVGNLNKTVSLAEANRNVMVDGRVGETGKVIGWYSWYVFTANVPVKDVNTDIVVQLIDAEGNNVGTAYTYQVREYVDYVIDHESDPIYAPFVNVAKSLLDYSATAASYFADRNGSATLDSNLATRLNAVTIATVKDFEPSRTGSADGITLYGCSLEALDKANICIYFKVSSSAQLSKADITVKAGDEVVDFAFEDAKNGYMRVKITGIHAADLDRVYTITVGGMVINYSGLSYAYTALNSNTSDNLKTMAKALYLYWAAAQAMN